MRSFLNQTNLISLAKNIYLGGTYYDYLYQEIASYHQILYERILMGTLQLYDYNDSTLNQMSDLLPRKEEPTLYANFLLQKMNVGPISDFAAEQLLEEIISYDRKGTKVLQK